LLLPKGPMGFLKDLGRFAKKRSGGDPINFEKKFLIFEGIDAIIKFAFIEPFWDPPATKDRTIIKRRKNESSFLGVRTYPRRLFRGFG
jgi:hypothetical protein